LNRFYKAADRWFFLAHLDGTLDDLRGVEGLHLPDMDEAEVEPALERQFSNEPADVWVKRLLEKGIPAQVRVPVDELMVDPYAKQRGLSVSQNVDGLATTSPGVPVRLSRTPMRVGDPPVRPGSDAASILDELGMADELDRLEKAWVLQVHDLPPAWRAE
jgi:crotonobetainyl-CoA:carnitine CoA-transferase CaiB-like acyl-CoA transferase